MEYNAAYKTIALPVSSYFDTAFFEQETARLFPKSPKYIGHPSMVPEQGDYYVLPDKGRVLIRNNNGVELLSNVCRHRQATLLEGRGQRPNIVCPLHWWTYDLSGQLLGAPDFTEKPCLNLAKTPLDNWQGLLFEAGATVRSRTAFQTHLLQRFDFSGYQLDHVIWHECAYNWKTFIEVYLEDYHVKPFHPGLGQFVSCDNLQWDFGDWHSLQTVGVYRNLTEPGSPTYKTWQDHVRRLSSGGPPSCGAVWLTLYPLIMLEWYPPSVLVVSTLIPRGPRHTTNIVEFYHPEDIRLFEREFVEAEREAYMETAKEDDEIAFRMEAGRLALFERGEDEAGPYQHPLEDGMRHFHKFIRQHMGVIER